MQRSFFWTISVALSAITPTFADTQTVENVDALLADIEARQTQRQDACLQTFLRAPKELGDVAMAEFGACDLAAARIARAEIEALNAGLSAEMVELVAEQAQLEAFLATLQRLQLVAVEQGNAEAIQQIARMQTEIARMQTEIAALNASTAEIEAETARLAAEADRVEAENDRIRAETARLAASADAHAASNDRIRALSAQYEAQIECTWDNIARNASDDCDNPTIWRRFLAEQ